MGVCLQLTDQQLSSYLAAGWTLASGPFPNSGDCQVNCQGAWYCVQAPTSVSSAMSPGPANPCCPTSTIMYVTFGGVLAGLGEVTLQWDTTINQWEAMILQPAPCNVAFVAVGCFQNPSTLKWFYLLTIYDANGEIAAVAFASPASCPSGLIGSNGFQISGGICAGQEASATLSTTP